MTHHDTPNDIVHTSTSTSTPVAASITLAVPERPPAPLSADGRSNLRSTVRRVPGAFLEALLSHAEEHGGRVGSTAVDVGATRALMAGIHAAKERGRKLRREARHLLDDALVAEADIAARALVALGSLELEARLGTREQRTDAAELRALQTKPIRSRKAGVKPPPPNPGDKK